MMVEGRQPGRARTLGVALTCGALVGAVVLGVAGRALLRLVAVRRGMPPGYSLGSTGEVIAVGLLYGAVGGLLLGGLGASRARHPLIGALVGLLLFGIAFFTSESALSSATGVTHTFAGSLLGPSSILFLTWGAVTSWLVGATRRA